MKRIVLTLLLAVALPALADRLPLPADTPASYAAECGSCHLAYPPALLSAGDWRRIMAGLNDHFGTDAAVDGRKRAGNHQLSRTPRRQRRQSWAAPAIRRASARPPALSTSTMKYLRSSGAIRA